MIDVRELVVVGGGYSAESELLGRFAVLDWGFPSMVFMMLPKLWTGTGTEAGKLQPMCARYSSDRCIVDLHVCRSESLDTCYRSVVLKWCRKEWPLCLDLSQLERIRVSLNRPCWSF